MFVLSLMQIRSRSILHALYFSSVYSYMKLNMQDSSCFGILICFSLCSTTSKYKLRKYIRMITSSLHAHTHSHIAIESSNLVGTFNLVKRKIIHLQIITTEDFSNEPISSFSNKPTRVSWNSNWKAKYKITNMFEIFFGRCVWLSPNLTDPINFNKVT